MKKRITMKDVAKATGVNVSTVSRALDPKSSHPISREVIKRIQRAAKRLGFRLNAAGQSLKTNRSKLVGVVVPDITDPVFPPIIRGLEDGLARHGYAAILANTDGNAVRESEIVEIMRARGVDGLAIASIKYHDKLFKKGASQDLPIVFVGRHTDNPSIMRVVHDEEEGLRLILNHLGSYGHKNIAFIAGPQDISTGRNRLSAFQKHRSVLRTKNSSNQVVFAESFNEQEGERCANDLLAKSDRFTALVCANDRLAIGAISALKRYGKRCPEDVSVTGFNDMPMVDRLDPPLTTIRIQQYKVGFEAAEYLVSAMENPALKKKKSLNIVLPVELIIRGSTKPVGKS
jgi:LacI family transcriptional regulator, galactose operon repressor